MRAISVTYEGSKGYLKDKREMKRKKNRREELRKVKGGDSVHLCSPLY